MLSQNFVTVDAGASAELNYKLDFQQGVAVISIIPVEEDESSQVSRNFSADAYWSNNNKYFVCEPICSLSDDSMESSGESLVTTIQAVFCRISVKNLESTTQKFYVSLNIPGTPSPGVI